MEPDGERIADYKVVSCSGRVGLNGFLDAGFWFLATRRYGK
jgi:hypothetical protein